MVYFKGLKKIFILVNNCFSSLPFCDIIVVQESPFMFILGLYHFYYI